MSQQSKKTLQEIKDDLEEFGWKLIDISNQISPLNDKELSSRIQKIQDVVKEAAQYIEERSDGAI